MKSNRKIQIILLLSSIFIFYSCSHELKMSYDCSCFDEKDYFKNYTYKDLVTKWGEPQSKRVIQKQNKDGFYYNSHINVIWEVQGLWKKSGEEGFRKGSNQNQIGMSFPAYDKVQSTEVNDDESNAVIHDDSNPDDVYCPNL